MEIDELPVDKLRWTEENVRNVEPSPRLVGSVGAVGVQHPLITLWKGDAWGVVDGNQRLQAAERLGLEEVPCEKYKDEYEALVAAEHCSVTDEWDPLHDVKNHAKAYDSLIEKGFSEPEAKKRVCDDLGLKQGILERHLDVWALPDPAKNLLKEPEERTEEEWEGLKNYRPGIKRTRNKLYVKAAAKLGKHVDEMDDDRVIQTAIEAHKAESSVDAQRIVELAISESEKSLREIAAEIYHLSESEGTTVDVGTINLPENIAEQFKERCIEGHIDKREFVKEAIEEKVLSEKGQRLDDTKSIDHW